MALNALEVPAILERPTLLCFLVVVINVATFQINLSLDNFA